MSDMTAEERARQIAYDHGEHEDPAVVKYFENHIRQAEAAARKAALKEAAQEVEDWFCHSDYHKDIQDDGRLVAKEIRALKEK